MANDSGEPEKVPQEGLRRRPPQLRSSLLQTKFRQTKLTFLEYVASNPYSKLLTPISTIFGFSDIGKALLSGRTFPVVSVGLAATIGAFLVYNFRRLRPVQLKDPAASGEFYPFLGSLPDRERDRFIVPRPDDLKQISDSIGRNVHVYSIISGESGAGKTILLSMYARPSKATPLVDDTSRIIRLIDDQVNSFTDLLTSTFPLLKSDRDAELNGLIRNALEAITPPDSRKESISDHFATLLHYLRGGENDTLVLVYEQSERLSANIRNFTKRDFDATLIFFEALREVGWIRVAFVTRNDRATDVLTLLPRQTFDVIFINSLQLGDRSTSDFDIKPRFHRICTPTECEKIIAAATKNGVHNTFVLALAGYIVEAMGAACIINDQNPHGYDGIHHIISIYLRLISDEYSYLNKDASARADLEIVMYALALYNHRTNLASTVDNAARISHLPRDRVEAVMAYLEHRDLIRNDQGSHDHYRLAHDLLSDHLMRREENEYLRIDHALAMQQIVDRRVPKDELIEVESEKDPFISTIMDARFPNLAAFLLWVAALFYGLRLAAPEVVFSRLSWFNSWLESHIPGVVSHNFEIWYYLPIAFTQYVWVLFMFGLDRGFFQYVTKLEHRPIMRWALHLAGPFGAALGFFVSFAPSLFIVPIVIPGLVLAGSYLWLWWKHSGGKLIGDYYVELGWATIANMVISLIVCAGLTELLVLRTGINKTLIDFVSILLVCASFWYFAYAMRGLQGSLTGRAAMLSIYDAGRRRQHTDRTV